MKAILNVENFTFSYGSVNVLENISFNIKTNEIIGLLGENGSGKTTLLDSIYGFHSKISSISLFSINPSIDNPSIKKAVSYIQDTPNLLEYLTAAQYISFLCKVENINYTEIQEELASLIDKFGLSIEYETRLLKNYSFGMRKKIQIISEFILHKEVIMIDEPTNGLDIRMIILLKELIMTERRNHNTTFIISSHNTGFLKDICSRVLLFHDKKIMSDIDLKNNIDLENEFLNIYQKRDV